jgi:hypothetical protein
MASDNHNYSDMPLVKQWHMVAYRKDIYGDLLHKNVKEAVEPKISDTGS